MKRVPVLPSAAEALGIARGAACPEEGGEARVVVWEACILLITGRTHQVKRERGLFFSSVFFPCASVLDLERLLKKKKNKTHKTQQKMFFLTFPDPSPDGGGGLPSPRGRPLRH